MKRRNLALLLLLGLFLGVNPINAQTPRQPVSAGSSQQQADHSPQADSARYKAAQERDRERIRKAIKQGRENVQAMEEPRMDRNTKKIYAKVAIYAVFGAIALVFYIRKRKKKGAGTDDTQST